MDKEMVKSNISSSKATLSYEWKDRVLEMEMKELEKLEKILLMEKEDALARKYKLEDIEHKEEEKRSAARR